MCSIALLGVVVSAAGSIVAGQQQAQMAEYQARADEQQAQADAEAAGFEASRERRRQELAAANARAQVGASGVALTGSPTEVLTANAREGQLDIQAIRYGSQLRQNNLRTQAGISRFQGKQARTAGFINAASGAISGLSNLYDPNKAVRFGGSAFSSGGLY
jgi:hypothetical protein